MNPIAAVQTDLSSKTQHDLNAATSATSQGLTTNARAVCPSNEGISWLSTVDGQDAHRDKQIRHRLVQLKSRYARQFKNMHALTTTFQWFTCMRTEGKSPEETSPLKTWQYDFRNEFTKDRWRFIQNLKTGHIDKKALYMSNVIAYQFERAFDMNGWLLALPQTIVQFRIANEQTNDVLLAHQTDYQSQAFKDAFLQTTVNGKSTVRVAEDLGMIIDRLTVIYNDQPVDSLPHSVKNRTPYYSPFSVLFHVRPNPDIYGHVD